MKPAYPPYMQVPQMPVVPQGQPQHMGQVPLMQQPIPPQMVAAVPREMPSAIQQMLISIEELYRLETRERAILDLSKNRDRYQHLGPALWYSVGVMPIMLQEIVAMYPLLSAPGQACPKTAINRTSSILTLLTVIAHSDITRKAFLDSQICLFLYPFLRVTQNERTDVLCLTSLGVIGALVKADDPAVITYLLNTEIFPLCLRIMENAVEISKIISSFIVQKLLSSSQGLNYACQTPNRFTVVVDVLKHMVSEKNAEGQHVCSTRLLRHIIRCYLRLSENERARIALSDMLPEELRNNTFHQYLEKDTSMKKCLLQLLVNIGDEGAKRVKDSIKPN